MKVTHNIYSIIINHDIPGISRAFFIFYLFLYASDTKLFKCNILIWLLLM